MNRYWRCQLYFWAVLSMSLAFGHVEKSLESVIFLATAALIGAFSPERKP